MGTPLLINGYRCMLNWAAQPGGRPWSTKFDYVSSGVDATPDPQDVAELVEAQFSTAWTTGGTLLQNNFNTNTQLENVVCYRLTDPLLGGEAPGNAATDGAIGTVLPAEVAVVASLRTTTLGRRYRGRQYWGGLSAFAVENSTGAVLTTFRTALVNLVVAMKIVSSGDITLTHSVISGQGGTGERPPGLATPVTSVIVDSFPDTQRRRGGR